jgi:DNA-binding transcriptional LysR family regulator
METNRLRQFCTIYETVSLRQSAEIMGMTHGALSKSIKVLEEELGRKLFMPAGRGIIPTKDAEKIYFQAKKIIKEIDKLTLKENDTDENVFKIGSFEVFTTYFLSLLNEDLAGIHLELHELLQGSLEIAVRDGIVDIGVTYEPIPTSGVDFLAIKKIRMSPYVRHNFFNNIKISEIPFAAPLQPIMGAPTGVKGLDGWPDHEFPRNIKYKVDMMESAIELCRQGHCAIFIPDFIALLHNEIVKEKFSLSKLPYPKKMKIVERTIYIVKRKNAEESAQMKKIARFLRSL